MVQTGDKIEILDEGVYDVLPQNKNEVLKFQVKIPSGDEKTLTMNATSQRWMLKKYGEDSKKWIGQKVEVFIVNMKVFNKFKDVIFLGESPEGAEPKPLEEEIKEEEKGKKKE